MKPLRPALALLSLLAAASAGAQGIAPAGTEWARVLSSTPVVQQFAVQHACTPQAIEASGLCTGLIAYESRTVGYQVTYEYAGRQYTAQMPQDPGANLAIQVTPLASAAPAAPVVTTTTITSAPVTTTWVSAPAAAPVVVAPPVVTTVVSPVVVSSYPMVVAAPLVAPWPVYRPYAYYPPVSFSLNLGYVRYHGGRRWH